MKPASIVRTIILLLLLVVFARPAAAQFYEKSITNVTSSTAVEKFPAVEWGNGFGVVWYRGNSLRYTRFDENNKQCKSPITIYTSPNGFFGYSPGIVYFNSLFHVIFVRKVGTYTHVFLRRVHYNYDPFGTARQLTSGDNYHSRPAVAYNGSEVGLAYIRSAGDGKPNYIFFQRYDTLWNPVGIPVQVYKSSKYLDNLNLVWSGKYWGFAWVVNNKKIVFQRLRSNGKKKGGVKKVFSSNNSSPPAWLRMVARDSGAYACAFNWRKGPSGGSQQIWFRRLRKNGKPTGPLRQISHSTGDAYEPALTWDRLQQHYGIFWSDTRDNEAPPGSPPSVGNNIYGALLSKAGVPYVTDTALTSTSGYDRWPAIVNNGDIAQLVWTRTYLPNMDIWSAAMICEFW